MQHIIFTKSTYFSIPRQLRTRYKFLGGTVYALDPKYMTININRLPKWLSLNQYNFFKNRIGYHYQLITHGFGREAIPLMKLNAQYAFGLCQNHKAAINKEGVRITEQVYWSLVPKERVKYQKVIKGNKIYYANKAIPSKKLISMVQPVIKPLTTDIKKSPIGRWIEVP